MISDIFLNTRQILYSGYKYVEDNEKIALFNWSYIVITFTEVYPYHEKLPHTTSGQNQSLSIDFYRW